MTAPRIDVEAVSVTYSQEEDSDGRASEEVQTITVSTADAGAGPYLVIATDRWAIEIEEIETFVALLRRVAEMAGGKP